MGNTNYGVTKYGKAALRLNGLSFAERFISQTEVENNGGKLFNSPTFDDGLVLNGSNQYATWNVSQEFWSEALSVVIEFTPDFDADGNSGCFFDAGTPNDEYLFTIAAGTLRIDCGDLQVCGAPYANYGAYWNVGEKNILVFSGASGNNRVWLNGNEIVNPNAAQNWNPKPIDFMYLGRLDAGIWYFDGTIHDLQIYRKQLSESEALALSNKTMWDYMGDASLYCNTRESERTYNTQTRKIANIYNSSIELEFEYPISDYVTISHEGTLELSDISNDNTKLTFTGTGTLYNLSIKDWTGRTIHYYDCSNGTLLNLFDGMQDNHIKVNNAIAGSFWANGATSDYYAIANSKPELFARRQTWVNARDMISHTDSGTVWYVRPSGGSYGTEDGTSYANAWDGFTNITWGTGGVEAGDTLYVCGAHSETLSVGASGADGAYIKIRFDFKTDIGSIDSGSIRARGLDIPSRNYIWVKQLTSTNATDACLHISGTSQWVYNEDSVLTGSGNQGVQHLNTCKVIHYNMTSSNNTDDGISVHDSAQVIVEKCTLNTNSQAINTISTSETYIYDATATGTTTEFLRTTTGDLYFYINGFTADIKLLLEEGTNIIKNGSVTTATGVGIQVDDNGINPYAYISNIDFDSANEDVYVFENATCVVKYCKFLGSSSFDNVRVTSAAVGSIDFTAQGNVFTGLAGSKAAFYVGDNVATVTSSINNNTMKGASDGIGIRNGTNTTTTADNNIFVDLKWANFDSVGVTGDYNVFFNNTLNEFLGNSTYTNSITTDPNLDANGKPQSGGSGINAAKDLGWQLDLHPDNVFGSDNFLIGQEYVGSAWDCGAYIYTTNTVNSNNITVLTGSEDGYELAEDLNNRKGTNPDIKGAVKLEDREGYELDGYDDYIDLPDRAGKYPYMRLQDINDPRFSSSTTDYDNLKTAGAFDGYLYKIALFDTELNGIQQDDLRLKFENRRN